MSFGIQNDDEALSMRVTMECGNFDDGGEDRYGELKRRIRVLLEDWNLEHAPENKAIVLDD